MMALTIATSVCNGLNIKTIQGKSMKQNLLRCVAASAVVLMGPVAAGVAQATNVAVGQATLSKLSYRLTDTDTKDGVAAAIRLNIGPYDGTDLAIREEVFNGLGSKQNSAGDTVQGSDFLTSKGVVTSDSMPLTKASKVGTTLTAQSGFTNAEARTILSGPYATDVRAGESSIFAERVAKVESYAFSDIAPGLAFDLAPHTSVTFFGNFDVSTGVDMGALFNSEAFAKARANDATLKVSSTAYVNMSIGPYESPQSLASDGPQFVERVASRQGTLDSHGRLTMLGDAPSSKGLLKLTYTNTTDQVVSKFLRYDLNVTTALEVLVVPEPGTWSLMALGLVGVAVVSRQRRKA